MRVGVACRSVLLQKSLETFLGEHLENPVRADVVISDEALLGHEHLLRIGNDKEADIVKPFSKAQLFIKLEQFYKNKKEAQEAMQIAQELDEMPEYEQPPLPEEESVEEGSLEAKINRLTAQYVKGVMRLVKEHYGE